MLTKSLGDIDWSAPAEEIERLIRGLNPWPSAYTHWNGRTLKLWAGEALSGEGGAAPCSAEAAGGEPKPGQVVRALKPGQVVRADKDCLAVMTGGGLLRIKELQLEGKKRMDAAAFLRGCPVKAGDVFCKKESE